MIMIERLQITIFPISGDIRAQGNVIFSVPEQPYQILIQQHSDR